MSADVDELIDAQKVGKTAGSQKGHSNRDPMDASEFFSSTNAAAAVGDDHFVCNATTAATVIRRRNIHQHTPNGGNAAAAVDMDRSVTTRRNQPNSTAIKAKSSQKSKRKHSSSSNINTFSSVFTALFSNKQRLTYGAIAISLAVSLYPFVKYHLGFVGSDTRSPHNNKRPDALRAAAGGGGGGLDHQHINDMIGASQHMHRHPGMHAGVADKKPGSSKANENRHGRTRGGGFGLGSLLGGGMGSLYSAGAIMFALYSFAKVFMRRKKKKNVDDDEEEEEDIDDDDDEPKHNKKKKKQNKQVRGKKRHIDEDELSGSDLAADEQQQQRDDDGRSSAGSSPTTSSSSSIVLEVDHESLLSSSTDNEQTEHDAGPEADSAAFVRRANKQKSDTNDDATDELRRLLAETQKRLQLLEQQQEALKNNKLR